MNIRTDRTVPAAPSAPRFDYSAPAEIEFRYRRYPVDRPPGLECRRPEENVPGAVAGADNRLRWDGRDYVLAEIHWHTPSEHLVDGRSYWLEQHLVHHAAEDPDALLVAAVFWAAGAANAELHRIFQALPRGRDTCAAATVTGVRLDRLLPQDTGSYVYPGSLTTGAYTEGVDWLVLRTPLTADHDTLAAFEDLFPCGNACRVHPLRDRTVALATG